MLTTMKISFLMLFFGFVFASAEINVESAAPDENSLKSIAVPDEVKDHNDANIAVDELVAEDDNKNDRDSIDGADSDDNIDNIDNTDNDDDEDVSDSDNTDDDNDDDDDEDVNDSDNDDDVNDSDNTDEVDLDDDGIEGDNDIEDDDAFDVNNVGLRIRASFPFNRRYLAQRAGFPTRPLYRLPRFLKSLLSKISFLVSKFQAGIHRYRRPWPIQTRRYVIRRNIRIRRPYRKSIRRYYRNRRRFRSKTPRRHRRHRSRRRYQKYGSRRRYRRYGIRRRYRSRRYRSRRYRG